MFKFTVRPFFSGGSKYPKRWPAVMAGVLAEVDERLGDTLFVTQVNVDWNWKARGERRTEFTFFARIGHRDPNDRGIEVQFEVFLDESEADAACLQGVPKEDQPNQYGQLVFRRLSQAIEEWIRTYEARGRALEKELAIACARL